MATLVSANYNGYHHNFNDLTNCIRYILNRDKIIHRYYGVTGMIVPISVPFDKIGDYIAGRMIETALPYDRPNTIKIRHLIVSFDRNELTDPAIADDIARKCLAFFAYYHYHAIYGVHEDADHVHIHFAFNPVSYADGTRYRGRHDEFNTMKTFFLDILHEYGIYTLMYYPQPSKDHNIGI